MTALAFLGKHRSKLVYCIEIEIGQGVVHGDDVGENHELEYARVAFTFAPEEFPKNLMGGANWSHISS